MKKKIFFALVASCVLAMAAHAATPMSTQYQHIKNTWVVPNSTYPNCSATVAVACLNSYTYTAVDPNGSPNIVTLPNGGIASGASFGYTWGPGGFLYCGTWSTSVVVNYIDSTGASVSSTAISTTAAVACPLVPSPATGLGSTPAP
jgi:hypothetical protein